MSDAQETQTRRDQLLRSTREAHTRLEELLASLPKEEQVRPGVTDGWSVKDHLAHLTWWEQSVICIFAGDPDPIAAIPGGGDGEDAITPMSLLRTVTGRSPTCAPPSTPPTSRCST